jgi:superfamily II DNA helicase RecQ
MAEYAEAKDCRRRRVLDYFGDEEELPAGTCGHCDGC